MTQPLAPTALLQPFDEDFLRDPYPVYASLRAKSPVHHVALPDGSPIWLVTRDADVRAGLSDPRLSVDKAHSGTGFKGYSLPPELDANLLNIGPDDHRRLRRLVSKAFTPRHVERLRNRVQHTTERLVEHLAQRMAACGHADAVEAVSNPLPITVIGDLLGVPEKDRLPFSQWVTSMAAPDHPSDIVQAIDQIHRFLIDLVAMRRANPDDNLLSSLISVRDGGDQLTEDELVSLAFLLLMAGSENTQHLISGGMLTLLNHREQLEAIRSDPRLMPAAVEELLRFTHPNQMAIRRFPTEPIEIGGVSIEAGDTVMLCLASANRDPARYADPDTFDIFRKDSAHLSLGQGIHYCLGAPLARIEIEIALSTILQRFPDVALACPAEQLRWRVSVRSRGLRALPLNSGQ